MPELPRSRDIRNWRDSNDRETRPVDFPERQKRADYVAQNILPPRGSDNQPHFGFPLRNRPQGQSMFPQKLKGKRSIPKRRNLVTWQPCPRHFTNLLCSVGTLVFRKRNMSRLKVARQSFHEAGIKLKLAPGRRPRRRCTPGLLRGGPCNLRQRGVPFTRRRRRSRLCQVLWCVQRVNQVLITFLQTRIARSKLQIGLQNRPSLPLPTSSLPTRRCRNARLLRSARNAWFCGSRWHRWAGGHPQRGSPRAARHGKG